jgi:xanthine dehydrogenase accessory factor
MRELLKLISTWGRTSGKAPVYLGTVTYIEGSAVRGTGATMAVSADGKLAGSVSGGCIESTVYNEALRLREKGQGRALTFCSTDDDIVGTPAPCGGTVGVAVYPADPAVAEALAARIAAGKDERWGVVTAGDAAKVGLSFALDEQGGLVAAEMPDGTRLTGEECAQYEALLTELEAAGSLATETSEAFCMYRPAVPRLCIAGGSHLGSALLQLAGAMGWRVVVVDPREIFAEERRFASADSLLHEWPARGFERLAIDRNTAVAALTHNQEMDDEAMREALRRGCFYAGVLGSRRTFAERKERLRSEGFSESDLNRIHAPIGLDIRAVTPEEIALSIMAEIVGEYRKYYGKEA